MDVSKISQQTINKNIENAKKYMTEQDVEECNIGLGYADSNRDGSTTGIDMYKEWSSTCEFVFEGNEEFAARGEEISMEIGEIYSRYAGSDGKLDAYEYNAALQSDEMGVLIDEYWEMKNTIEAQNGEDVPGLNRYDSDNDGDVSTIELFKERSEINSRIFEDDEEKEAQVQEIVQKQAEIISKYAGDDGVISSEEYTQAVQSAEYQETLAKYKKLMQ